MESGVLPAANVSVYSTSDCNAIQSSFIETYFYRSTLGIRVVSVIVENFSSIFDWTKDCRARANVCHPDFWIITAEENGNPFNLIKASD